MGVEIDTSRPAPKRWRKFENAYIIILLPAITAVVEGWGLNDTKAHRMLLIMGASASIVKAIGYFIANGEQYIRTKELEAGDVPIQYKARQ